MGRRTFRPNTTIRDEYGNFIQWKDEFKKKGALLSSYYEEETPFNFLKECLPAKYLDSYLSKEDAAEMEIVGRSTHTGRGTGLVKRTVALTKSGKPKVVSFPLYDDYNASELLWGNRFALINLCTYFGKGPSKIPGLCFGLAIDLDYVREKELLSLFGKMENDMIPVPTYIVNSGAGLHLYYLFEQPVPLKDTAVQSYLTKVKVQLVEQTWTTDTSIDLDRQFQGIYQDMRIPGSWSKLGWKNKKRCSYIIKAYKTGERVDLTYLSRYCENLPSIEDLASESTTQRLSLYEAKEKYPEWYQRVVVLGAEKGHYIQSRGLYEWWKEIITQPTPTTGDQQSRTSHEGNRFYCICVLFVMAYKAGVPLEEVTQDALDLIPFMNTREHHEGNEFSEYDVMSASTFYSAKYVRWGNRGIAKHCSITLPPPKTRRNGRTQEDHLKRARLVRTLSTYDNVGRPKGSEQQIIVEEWQQNNPGRKKADCIRETGLSKPTVYRWWK